MTDSRACFRFTGNDLLWIYRLILSAARLVALLLSLPLVVTVFDPAVVCWGLIP
jgi:hypothetical protein